MLTIVTSSGDLRSFLLLLRAVPHTGLCRGTSLVQQKLQTPLSGKLFVPIDYLPLSAAPTRVA